MQYIGVHEWLKDMWKAERDCFHSTTYIDLNRSYETNKKVLTFYTPLPTNGNPRRSGSTLLLKFQTINKA